MTYSFQINIIYFNPNIVNVARGAKDLQEDAWLRLWNWMWTEDVKKVKHKRD